jgi:hypothetical protein
MSAHLPVTKRFWAFWSPTTLKWRSPLWCDIMPQFQSPSVMLKLSTELCVDAPSCIATLPEFIRVLQVSTLKVSF